MNNEPRPSICLCIIAKNDFESNESHVILRCLDSFKNVIDDLAMVTTSKASICGNVDALAYDWAIKNKILWKGKAICWENDFSRARNAATELAIASFCQWIAFIDADEWLDGEPEQIQNLLRNTRLDAVSLPMLSSNGSIKPRLTFVRNVAKFGWRWEGIIHEDLMENGQPITTELSGDLNNLLAGPHIKTNQDGARSQDPYKLENDIAILEQAYDKWKDIRYLFFLAESKWIRLQLHKEPSKDELEMVIGMFKQFVDSGNQKIGMVYHACLVIARIYFLLGQYDRSLMTFLSAYNICPTRVEALGGCAEVYTANKAWAMVKVYALACAHAPVPDPSALEYLEPEWADWKGLYLLITSLFNLNQIGVFNEYVDLLLSKKNIPEEIKNKCMAMSFSTDATIN